MALQILNRKPLPAGPIVGIDLGTTNSLVAIVRDGVPVVLSSRDGRRLIPSVVSLKNGQLVIGDQAKNNKVRDAEHTVFSVKRLLGRGFDDLKSVAATLPYRILPGEGVARIQLGDRAFSAVEISAMILGELKKSAEDSLGVPVTRAVITVPAYFNDSQRQATRTAGRLAGLDVLRIVNEPTAASLAYGLDRKRQGLIAVYDLGGGTFDISILKLHDGIFEVLATNGNTSLGGDDLDQAIARVVASELRDQFEVDPFAPGQSLLLAAVLESAEAVKIALSTQMKATFEVSGSDWSAGPEKTYRRDFSRAEFEVLAKPILESTRGPCLAALKDAGLKLEDLSDVVLVGGPTRLAVVQRMAEDIFGRKPNTSMHPDEVVAAGAAIQADILAGNNQELLLLDVVPLSLGLETYGGVMAPLISRNTRIPAVARQFFTTFVDNQTGVDIHVLQGERDRVEDNRSLARFKLKGIQPMPAGMPRIEVAFLIDADGILQVAAKDLQTGHEQSVEVRPSYGLSDVEVENMLRASQDNAESDVRFRKVTEAKTEAERVLHAAEKKLPDAFRLLPGADAQKIETEIVDLKQLLGQSDVEKIRDSAQRLSGLTTRLAELLIKEAISKAESRPGGS